MKHLKLQKLQYVIFFKKLTRFWIIAADESLFLQVKDGVCNDPSCSSLPHWKKYFSLVSWEPWSNLFIRAEILISSSCQTNFLYYSEIIEFNKHVWTSWTWTHQKAQNWSRILKSKELIYLNVLKLLFS